MGEQSTGPDILKMLSEAHGMSVEEYQEHTEREAKARLEAERKRREREKQERAEAWAKGGRIEAIVNRYRDVLPEDCRASDRDIEMLAQETWQPTRAFAAAARFWDSDCKIFIVAGPVGTGKTLSAMYTALRPERQRIEEQERRHPGSPGFTFPKPRRSALEWVSAPMLARRFDPWRFDAEQGVTPLCSDSEVLVIDDLGTEMLNDRWHAAFDALVDMRYVKWRTVITTNLPAAEIRPRYGDRIADRLNDAGAFVELRGASMRRKGKL